MRIAIYAKNRYAINQTIFFTCEWLWFGILESYAIKRFMPLTDFVCSNYSKIFSNCGVDLYTGNTFDDAISCLKMCIDLYTRSTYTRVYMVFKIFML